MNLTTKLLCSIPGYYCDLKHNENYCYSVSILVPKDMYRRSIFSSDWKRFRKIIPKLFLRMEDCSTLIRFGQIFLNSKEIEEYFSINSDIEIRKKKIDPNNVYANYNRIELL